MHRAERQRDRDHVYVLLAAVAHEIGDCASNPGVRMQGGNAAGGQTVIVDPYDFECVRFRLQPLDKFLAEVVDRDDGDTPTKVAGLRPSPEQ